MTAPPVPVGSVIAGKYRVEKVLGAGAMGVVVAARHLDLQELRAIKLMLPAGQESAESVERFMREARAAARLKSQHVAKVHDVGKLDDGAPYAVIEYLEGTDLKALLDSRGTIPVGEAAMYLSQVCEAIGEAHAAGIVHRDLKPANLFLTRGPTGAPVVKVLDFGIAKMAAADGAPVDMTATSAMLGTPLYMSPEQMRGARDVDARADIWALGVILYRMMTGRTPFAGSSVTEICAAVVADTPPTPRAIRGDVPAEVEAVILRCLQKNPAQRFASVGEFAAALAHAAGGAGRASAVPAAPAGGGGMALMGTMVMDPPSAAAVPAAAGGTFGPAPAPLPAPPPPGANATFGPAAGGGTFGPAAAGGTFGPAAAGGGTFGPAPAAANATFGAGAPQWQANQQTAPAAQMPGGQSQAGWGAPNAAVAAGGWGPQAAPAQAPAKSRTGLFVGLAVAGTLGIAAVVAVFAWPSSSGGSSSNAAGPGPSTPGVTAPGVTTPGAAASPGATGAQASAPGASKPSGKAGTPAFGQGSPSSVAPAASSASGTPAPPASSASAAPAAGGASAKSIGMLQGAIMTCWKGNEGANKGEAASSATVQVTVGPPRSVLVSGPAKAKSAFTSCVVSKASSLPFDPGEIVVASASLPAGPT